MELISLLADGFAVALTPQNLFLAVVGCFLGTLMGALPGLGPANGVAILIPIAFSMGLGPDAFTDFVGKCLLWSDVWGSDQLDPVEYSG